MSERASDKRHRASPAARSPAAAAGRVILGGAPLGRPADVSASMRAALAATPVIAAEDTRRLRRLCADLGVTPTGRIVSFFEANESSRVPSLLEAVESGEDVLVVTDAGMPSISDPGYRLVVAAIAAGLAVTALPGPSAVTTAVALSGLPVDRYCFEGFLPRRHGERVRALAALADERRTMVFFESPRRLAATLGDLAAAFGADRRAAVCRELTKTYEEIRRGTVDELADWAVDVRGEITLVVAGATAAVDDTDLAGAVAEREAAGETRKEAIAEVARVRGIPKRAVFDAVVAAKS
jgi:16S rRNA (cytidine1402-2'-O)-methyltransferase